MALTITKTGTTLAVTGTSARVAIPTDTSGVVPKCARVSCSSAMYVKIGDSSVSAVAGDLLIHPAESVELRTIGLTHIAAIQVSAAGTLQISPIEV